jgi:hypothetical protein
MLRRGFLQAVILPLTVSIALADAPSQSLRPSARPDLQTQALATIAPTIRPQSRPTALGENAPVAQVEMVSAPAANTKTQATMQGAVCENPNIKGMALKPIASPVNGCNVKAPVQVSSVNGVRLDPPAVINCDEAAALALWIKKGVQPAFNNQVVQLNVAASYDCRPRNNVRGAKVSEHGLGNAIDISGFVLNTGKTMTVASNYNKQIRAAQKAACGPFRTTLGPGSDGYHESHIHFDIAHNRGRPYCH